MSETPPGGEPEASGPASRPVTVPGWPQAAGPGAGTSLAGAAPDGPESVVEPDDFPPRAPIRGRGGAGRPVREPLPGRRPPPRKANNRWRTAFFGLAALAIILGVAWALLGNRLLVVRSVSVTGTHLVTPTQVIAAADVPLGTPLLRVDPGAVSSRVEQIRQVASATVTEDWPDHLVITVTERVPVMSVKMAGGGYDLLDRRGLVRYTKIRPAALPVFETSLAGSAMDGSTAVAAAAEVLGDLQPWLAGQVAKVSVTQAAPGASGAAEQQVNLALGDGKAILWGDPGNAAQKNRELKILLSGTARYIDVSAPGTVVTK